MTFARRLKAKKRMLQKPDPGLDRSPAFQNLAYYSSTSSPRL